MQIQSTAMNGLDGQNWKEQMLTGGVGRQEQVEQIASEFEGILIRQYLDKALAPMDPESGFFGAKGSPMYEQLIKDSLATSITRSGSLGFSSVLQAQLFPEASTIEKGKTSHE